MKKRTTIKDWLPLGKTDGATAGVLPTGEAFRPEWIDFEHGLRVGNLEPYERITQILKYHLEQTYGTTFVTDRWGRGVYWQWICWLPRVNREAKPISHHVNFGCAKLFITTDSKARTFKSGLQIERGFLRDDANPAAGWVLQEDWDWHRLMAQCKAGTPFDRELKRLLTEEGFVAEIGNWGVNAVFNATNYSSAAQLKSSMKAGVPNEWAGFQLYYPLPEKELRSSTGYEVVKATCAAFDAVVPAMNACMQIELKEQPGR